MGERDHETRKDRLLGQEVPVLLLVLGGGGGGDVELETTKTKTVFRSDQIAALVYVYRSVTVLLPG
jgi:hypothetical protein